MTLSVCIATYQGERFIAPQISSILAQLRDFDEVIVVDDHSVDRTCEVVRTLGDSRIRLVEHATNEGVSRSFEDAISLASGNLIFLSDQDDLWAPDKVTRIIEVFNRYPTVTLVTTDAALIDENGVHLARSYYETKGKFRSGLLPNLVRCRYLGCTMAFRSELVSRILPFPRGSEVLHDIWIGVVNSISSGTTCYLDQPLVWYRRHSAALTGNRRSLARAIRGRLQLLRALIGFWSRYLLARRFGT